MGTVTREPIGLLNDKITVKIEKSDYLPSFEKALKEYGKKANIPGFRKGMVPAGLIKKMYGSSVFTDEVLKSVEKKLTDYMARKSWRFLRNRFRYRKMMPARSIWASRMIIPLLLK